MTYTSSASGLTLETAQFAGGVIRLSGTSQEINYLLTDHLGSVRAVVTPTGTVRERNDYYAFGAKHVRSDYPQSANRFKFNGKELQTTGFASSDNAPFLDYGARMYDPAIGRWFNPDPLAESYFAHSPYLYCAGNPVLFVDPDGEDWRKALKLIGQSISGNASLGLQAGAKFGKIGLYANAGSKDIFNLSSG